MTEKELRKEVRELKKYLTALAATVTNFLAAMDEEMTKPSSVERGRAIGRLCSMLDQSKDAARRYGLKLDWDGKPSKKQKEDQGRAD